MPAEIKTIFSALFSDPIDAVLVAEKSYRRIWADWLNDLNAFIAPLPPAEQAAAIAKRLELAPVMKFAACIEAGITMRVASLTQKEGKVALSLGTGPFQISGGGGFSSQQSSESIFQARATYTLSNDADRSLKDYLGELKLDLATPSDITNAVTRLKALAA